MKTRSWSRRGLLGAGVVMLSSLSACATNPSFSRPFVDETTATHVLGVSVWTSSVEPRHYYCVGMFGEKYAPECSGTRYHLLCVCSRGNYL